MEEEKKGGAKGGKPCGKGEGGGHINTGGA